MIEPSAPPSIAKLLIAGAPHGEGPAESPISAQFAQLLALQFGIAPAAGQAPETIATPAHANPDPAIGKHSGKPGGKDLPDLPEQSPAPPEAPANEDAPGADDVSTESSSSESELPLTQLPATPMAGLTLLPLIDPAPATGAFEPTGLAARQPARALPAMPAALRLPAEAIADSDKPRVAAAHAGAEAGTGSGPAAAIPAAPQAAIPAAPQAARARSDEPGQPVQFVIPAATVPSRAPALSLAGLRLIPRRPESAEPAIHAIDLQPLPAAEPADASPPPAQAAQTSSAVQIVASLRRILAQGRADRPQAGNAATASPTLSPTAEPKPAAPAAPADGQSRPLALAPAAPEFAPELANMPPAPSAGLSAATSPAISPAPSPQAPVDFARLIDRLVEAREAMRSVQAPANVEAAIAHAEFGQVSMRFEQSGGALSVSLASPDPEFAHAVQAATPAVQQGTTPDSSGGAQRHDAPGQQGAGAAPGQSHSQQRGQPAAPRNGEPGQQPAARSQPRAEAPAPRRGGIFA